MVKGEKPKREKEYQKLIIKGIEIYVHKQLKYSSKVLKIEIKKFFGFHVIYAYDPETICLCGGYYKEEHKKLKI